MKKALFKFLTSVASFCCIFTLLSTGTVVSAETGFFGNKHHFIQGIQGVTCMNSIEQSENSDLYRAVNAAIADWDWHLGLLNDKYNVNYNLITVNPGYADTSDVNYLPMINFVLLETCPSSRVVPLESPAFTCFGDHYQGVEYEVFAEDDNWRWTSIEFYKDRIVNLNLSYDDFRVTANHEIGHALGLAHITDDTGVIMYPTGLRTATVPTAADLERIYDLYG